VKKLILSVILIIGMLYSADLMAQKDSWSDLSNRNTTWNWNTTSPKIESEADLAQLSWLVNNEGHSFKDTTITLATNLNLKEHFWVPIGLNRTLSFQGVFDGNGKKIDGLYIGIDGKRKTNGYTKYEYTGLFGFLFYEGPGETGIKNLKLGKGKVFGLTEDLTYTGALAGWTYTYRGSVMISDCQNQGVEVWESSTSGKNNYVDNLIGTGHNKDNKKKASNDYDGITSAS